jgi:hypothetical protein
MLPLLAFGIWNKGRWRVAGAVLLLVAGVAAWYFPSALLSGGLGPYREASSSQTDYLITYFSVFGLGARALAINSYTLLRFSLYALSAAIVLLPAFLWLLLSASMRAGLRGRRILFLAVWMAPSLLFYSFIHIGERGYIFSFLPVALLVGVRGLQIIAVHISGRRGGESQALPRPARMGGAQKIMWAVALPMLIANMLLFLVLSPPLSANRLAARDDILRSRIDTIEANFDPAKTLILSVYDYQHVLHYLPEFPSRNFDPSVEQDPVFDLPAGVDRVVIFDEYLSPANTGAALTMPLALDQTLEYMESGGTKKIRVNWQSRKVFLEDG